MDISSLKKSSHYNLWLEKKYPQRFSYKYKGRNNTPDNILLPYALFDDKNISYLKNSYNLFNPTYLYKNNSIQRWKINHETKTHQGIGYSDHLPIYALFSTHTPFKKKKLIPNKHNLLKISTLYTIENLQQKSPLTNVIVIYKNRHNAVIKQKNNRAIFIYKEAKKLELGNQYDLEIGKLTNYNGLKEITKIEKIVFKNTFKNYKSLYLDAKDINILEYKYQNEIITNLKATYKKGYLYYNYKSKKNRIKLYSKDISILPKDNEQITIISGHLAFYKSKPQIIIYTKTDFKGAF